MTDYAKGSIVGAILWMFIISILLFWLPVAGPLVAGLVGGMKAGRLGSAIIATILPSIVLGVGLFFSPPPSADYLWWVSSPRPAA